MNNIPLKASDSSLFLPIQDFLKFLQQKLRFCSKNRLICSDFKYFLNSSIEKLQERKASVPNKATHLESIKLDGLSCFMWFMVRTRKMRDLVPDIEFLKYRDDCLQMISKIGNCTEAHFGLGTLYAYEANFDAAISHIRIALSQNPKDLTFNVWNAVLTVFRVNSKKRALQAKKICYGNFYLELLKQKIYAIEIYWALMKLSLMNYLKIGTEIESPQHYAAKAKQIDEYIGLLAWGEIFLKTLSENAKGEILLKELINNYPSNPEAYLKLWNYYYYTTKNYEAALEISEKTYVGNVGKSENYAVIIALNYAKSLFKIGKLRNCFELLQLEYTKNSLFTVILFHYGRLCVKAKDSPFLGSAIGALEECLNTCSKNRHGQIYYWLTFAYLQAEEKIEAFNCAKEGINLLSKVLDKLQGNHPDFQRKITKKINTLQDLMKELHMHIISIEMLEKILEDSPPLMIEECKVYCASIHEFDNLEGFMAEAKMWWKAGKYRKSKRILYSQLSCTRVKMKVFFLLIEFLKSEGNYEEMLAVSKEIVKKCRSPMIPVQTWLAANIIFAKCLVKQGREHEALLVYKSLAQVQPIPFIPDMNYTRELQRSFTKEDLENVVSRLENKEKRYSYLTSTLTDYYIQRSKLVCSRQHITSALIGEEEEEYEKTSDRSKTVSTERSESELVGNRAPEPLPRSRVSSIPCGDSVNIGFSVTTSYEFLYKIGKTCAKHQVCVQEGLHAMHDFLNNHHYRSVEGLTAVEELKVKAKFWIGILYFQNKQIAQAKEVFEDILSMLFQLGRTKMSSEAKRILKLSQDFEGVKD